MLRSFLTTLVSTSFPSESHITSLQASLLKAMYASSSSVSPSITPFVEDAHGGVFALSGC